MATTELLVPQKAELVREESVGVRLLEMAIQKGAGLDELTKLMELHERLEANEARKAFNVAMARFKDDPPKIIKNKHVMFKTEKGVTEYDHATLDHVCDQITVGLSKVGITHKWIPRQKDGRISVTCILTHELGYRDPDPPTLEASPDESGRKNAIQAIGSTVTYLERYTLLAAVGMASGLDNDGNGAPQKTDREMEHGEFDRLCGLIENAGSIDSLKSIYMAACADAKALQDQGAIKSFAQIKDKRYKELAPKVGAK